MKTIGTINNLDTDNWYVLHVTAGREEYLKNLILRYSERPVNLRTFYRELIHKKNGKDYRIMDRLFPGYIFVQNDVLDIVKLVHSRASNEYIRPVSFNGQISKVNQDEMEFMLRNSNKDGIFALSYGEKDGDTIRILRGPLTGLLGKILFINEKKKKAKVEIAIFNRKIEISLGLEMVNSKKPVRAYAYN